MARTDFKSVDEYIASYPKDMQAVLRLVRRTIRKAVPAAEERISYQMPAYGSRSGPVIAFAGWKTHYSLYGATGHVVAAFKEDLAPYKVSKGTIRFLLSEAVPVKLIARIAQFRANQAHGRARTKRAGTTKHR
jgi:uncharacterized protein YdhG (YjbR/CyaY superfamily)